MRIAVIIPAAGAGRRFEQALTVDEKKARTGRTKIELEIAGKPVFIHSVELFQGIAEVEQILLAVNPDALDAFRFKYEDRMTHTGVRVVAGGVKERWETVLKALAQVGPNVTHVAVHDAARPLASAALIQRVFRAAASYPAVIPGCAVPATLKRALVVERPARTLDAADAILGVQQAPEQVEVVRRVTETVDRTNLYEVQTPQVFEVGLLKRAYGQITSGKLTGKGITDDAGLVEALGEQVHLVEGESTNLKVTLPGDLALAELIHRSRNPIDPFEKPRKKALFKDDEDE